MKLLLKLSLMLSLAALLAACGRSGLPGTSPSAATQPAAAVSPSPNPNLPQNEADVPRVSVVDAKAAIDSGEAVLVDARSLAAYNGQHAAGAISLPLGDIEADPAAVPLDKSKWIITYCT